MACKDLSELHIQYVKGVGPRRAEVLTRLGVRNVKDALTYFPYRYEDRRNFTTINQSTVGNMVTIMGKVVASEVVTLRRRLKLFELSVTDGSGLVKGKWFNQPFMQKRFRQGDSVVLSGQLKYGYKGVGLEIDNPEYEVVSDGDDALIHTGRTVPVYRATESLSSKQIRIIVHNVLSSHAQDICDPVPSDILARNGFPGLRESIENCHFPEEGIDVEQLNAWQSDYHRRVSFDELFLLELGLAVMKRDTLRESGIGFQPSGKIVSRLLASLPFSLTRAQERTFGEILNDMKSPWPAHRLVQGDVGSGKTIVALMAMLSAVECGYQAVLMAPTEILAQQHYLNIYEMIEDLGLNIALVTGSIRQKPHAEIAAGDVHVVVGTHALIHEGVSFKALGLAVIDEQHKFGVMQRAELRQKGVNPDILVMTATPIPRTLAMTLYGDLDYSVIDELPPGRMPVETVVLTPDEKEKIYKMIAQEVKSGGQVYVVYPVIEGSEKTGLRSAIMGEEALQKVFPSMRIELLHGRMRPTEREGVMEKFKKGYIDILVSTTVIEVGVDVPEASLMLIVHAERFGLSQLHQLRGRVGRGGRHSRCLLLAYGPLSEEADRRLRVMAETNNGFRIAEEDLSIRGPGEMLGTRQSGMPDLRVASLVRDAVLIDPARREAFDLVKQDPELESSKELKEAVMKFWHGKVELFKTA